MSNLADALRSGGGSEREKDSKGLGYHTGGWIVKKLEPGQNEDLQILVFVDQKDKVIAVAYGDPEDVHNGQLLTFDVTKVTDKSIISGFTAKYKRGLIGLIEMIRVRVPKTRS